MGVTVLIRNTVELLNSIEVEYGIKCIHNEINILRLLLDRGKVPSLEIFSQSRRSLAGHNADLRRLISNGLIHVSNGTSDKRERLYELTDYGRKILQQQESLLGEIVAEGNDKRISKSA